MLTVLVPERVTMSFLEKTGRGTELTQGAWIRGSVERGKKGLVLDVLIRDAMGHPGGGGWSGQW